MDLISDLAVDHLATLPGATLSSGAPQRTHLIQLSSATLPTSKLSTTLAPASVQPFPAITSRSEKPCSGNVLFLTHLAPGESPPLPCIPNFLLPAKPTVLCFSCLLLAETILASSSHTHHPKPSAQSYMVASSSPSSVVYKTPTSKMHIILPCLHIPNRNTHFHGILMPKILKCDN